MAVAEELTQSIKQESEQLLRVYRDNFGKITTFLRQSEDKETELLQSNRLLNEQIQTLTMEYQIYKNNFKRKATSQDRERRLKERLQKEYDQQLITITRQQQQRYQQQAKVK